MTLERSCKEAHSNTNKKITNIVAMDKDFQTTVDHNEIMEWAKERGGVPAYFLETDETDVEPKLVINFAAGEMDERIQEMTWEKFFEEFEGRKLAFRYKEINDDGRSSTTCEFVNRS